jgi:zinc protease
MTVDRTVAPVIHDAIEFDYILPPIQHVTMQNGIPLHWLNAGVQDVVEIDWVFPAGLWYEQRNGIAHAVAGLLKCGTATRTAAQINEALEYYGAQLKVGAGNDNSTVSLYSLTKHLPALLPVVLDVLLHATFPEDEVAIYKQNSIQRLLVSLRQPEFVANQKIDALLFGADHPYGRFSQREKIEAITQQDAVQFHSQYYNLANVRMFMAGKVGEQEVALLQVTFGAMPLQATELPTLTFATPPAAERSQRFMNDEKGLQGAVRIGRLFPNRQHADFTPMVVLNTLFGGYFGSRLMSNIREDKGYTYGIHSSLAPERNGGSLVIQTETGRDVAEKAVEEVYREMELLCNELVTEEELLLVKNYLLGNILGDLDGPFSILQRWRTLLLNGFDANHFNNNITTYKTISADRLQQLAQQYYQKDAFYELIVV